MKYQTFSSSPHERSFTCYLSCYFCARTCVCREDFFLDSCVSDFPVDFCCCCCCSIPYHGFCFACVLCCCYDDASDWDFPAVGSVLDRILFGDPIDPVHALHVLPLFSTEINNFQYFEFTYSFLNKLLDIKFTMSVLVAQSVRRSSRTSLCVRKRKVQPSSRQTDSKKFPSLNN